MQIRYKIYPKSITDALVTTFMIFLIPVIYYFELWIVLPRFHEPWCWTYLFHFCMGNIILFNICSNLVVLILTDTSINGKILPTNGGKNWSFCPECESVAPPRSWHCSTCNTCILKKDHHCEFTSCCIGHYNHRFFLVFVFYMFISTLYSTIFNFQYIYEFVRLDSWNTLIKIVFPLAILFLDWTENQWYESLIIKLYVSFIIIVTFACVFTGVLLFYHLNLVLKGMINHEKNDKDTFYDLGRMENLRVVLGNRWYLVWISPFIKSDLPCDGINWVTKHSIKGK